MYCAQCGKENQGDARFCSACGRPFSTEASAQAPRPFGRQPGSFGSLVRARNGRKVAGVCQGLANHYGWDVSVVRIVMLLLAILGFPVGLVIYGLVWVVAPEEPLALPSATYVSQS